MKERKLRNTGIEGDANDDWQLVNCKNFLVHVMLPSE
jgi:ribosomal silencing factor RsfS